MVAERGGLLPGREAGQGFRPAFRILNLGAGDEALGPHIPRHALSALRQAGAVEGEERGISGEERHRLLVRRPRPASQRLGLEQHLRRRPILRNGEPERSPIGAAGEHRQRNGKQAGPR